MHSTWLPFQLLLRALENESPVGRHLPVFGVQWCQETLTSVSGHTDGFKGYNASPPGSNTT
jgi:hypothetical protein